MDKDNQRQMVILPIQVNKTALKMIERNKRNQFYRGNNSSGGYSWKGQDSSHMKKQGMPINNQLIGASCRNNGCKVICKDAASANSPCVHHSGTLAFPHPIVTNGQFQVLPQSWTCCGRSSESLAGCESGDHIWIKRERVESMRYGWFYRAGIVHINISCSGAVPQGTRVQSDGVNLDVTIAHAFGTKETVKHFVLCDEILPSDSAVIISEKNVEVVLKQKVRDRWLMLSYEVDDGSEGAYWVQDEEAGTSDAVH